MTSRSSVPSKACTLILIASSCDSNGYSFKRLAPPKFGVSHYSEVYGCAPRSIVCCEPPGVFEPSINTSE